MENNEVILAYDAMLEYLNSMTRMGKHSERLKGYRYQNIPEFVLKEGKHLPKKRALPPEIPIGLPEECYRNAAMAAAEQDRFKYVEGYAIARDSLLIPQIHAWLIDPKEYCIEVTWEKIALCYYGVIFNNEYLAKTNIKNKKGGLIDRWEDEWPLLTGNEKDFKG